MEKEKGAVMVEAVIVFPIVLFTVFLLIYMGLFKLQEMSILYQVQRAAHQGAMIVESPGYKHLGDYRDKNPDFGSTINRENIENYYKSYHMDLTVLYREIFGYGGWTNEEEITYFLNEIGNHTLTLAGVSSFQKEVTVKRGFFSTGVNVEIIFSIPTPGVFKMFGFGDELKFKQGASAMAMNPAELVRNVDLAGDAIVIVSEKLGIDGELNKILEGIKKYLF